MKDQDKDKTQDSVKTDLEQTHIKRCASIKAGIKAAGDKVINQVKWNRKGKSSQGK